MLRRGRTKTPPHRGLVPLTAVAGGLLAVLMGLVLLMLLGAIQDARGSLLSARSGRPALDQVGVVEETLLDASQPSWPAGRVPGSVDWCRE
ncbi:hypothetical protein ABTY98_10835 [Streptomyces sp. NPDC096040]|uniref:hypothetical protein n=1 Tax=Streptomyces sp. NPDC096040 TaxID=3155541 RepID=UPI00332344B0